MQSTRSGEPARWLGVGLADRYAPELAPSAVCGLDPGEGGLVARFWGWTWDPPAAPLDVDPLQDEVRAARCVLLDGPQGLARAGRSARACEDAFRTPGRTPDHLPPPDLPLAGKLRSSVELFAAFFAARVRVSPVSVVGGLGEVFSGAFWRGLERFGLDPLPEAASEAGRRVRRALLEALGVCFPSPDLPSSGQLDACLAALTAAAADSAVRGVYARARGDGVFRTEDGFLREGPIVELAVQGFRADACREAFFALTTPPEPAPDAVEPVEPAGPESPPSPAPAVVAETVPVAATPTIVPGPTPAPAAVPAADPALVARAEALLDLLVTRYQRRPLVVTYPAAYSLLFPGSVRAATRWSPDLAQQVIAVASATTRREVPVLGSVALDTFIVDSTFKVPGRSHWKAGGYTVEQWRACFGLPEVAEPGDLRLDPLPFR